MWITSYLLVPLLVVVSHVRAAVQDDLGPNGDQEDWVDPLDMLNYDPATKTMKKPKVGQYFLS